jgi:predicted DNA-binding transcriptional regulator AlpA
MNSVRTSFENHNNNEKTHIGEDWVLSPKQTAAALSISLPTLHRLWKRGTGPRRRRISPRRVGSTLRDIGAYLDQCDGGAA